MPPTIYQRKVIDKTSGPAIVMAGAGSGKTHTMCERIVESIQKGRAGDETCPKSIEEVVAITFTNKAAGELKSRIRIKLNEAGLLEDARRVDEACISTIHGFAARILRENALQFGIDPGFRMLSEFEVKERRDNVDKEILNNVISGQTFDDDGMPNFENMALASVLSDDSDGSFKNLFDLASRKYSSLPDGVERLTYANGNFSPIDIIATLAPLMAQSIDMIESMDYESDNKAQELLGKFRVSLEQAEDFLDRHVGDGGQYVDLETATEEAIEIFANVPCTTNSFPSPKHANDMQIAFFNAYKALMGKSTYSILVFLRTTANVSLKRYAEIFETIWMTVYGNVAFGDSTILSSCLRFLKAFPDVASAYENAFKMIIVDEFQDTDKVQIDLISQIAQPQFNNVCTVGDIQQSIYGFRGADVNAFREYRDHVLEINKNAEVFELPNNFRSHKEIIAFVEKVFSSPSMFGDEFLKLTSDASLNKIHDPIFDDETSDVLPRVTVDIMHGCRSGKGQKFLSDQLIEREAKKIAIHFKELIDKGEEPGSMALLLGGTSNANVYRKALSDVGIDSVFSGGSTFSKSDEVKLVLNVLKVMENISDEQALYAVLKSELFNLSDEALMNISHKVDNSSNKFVNIPISEGLFDDIDSRDSYPIDASEKQKITFAKHAIQSLMIETDDKSPDVAIRNLFARCGVLSRLNEDKTSGLAIAGNYEQCFTILHNLKEYAFRGISGITADFESYLKSSNDSPNIYSSNESNLLQIMTVHASKGLQFDHVAVAEISYKSRSEQDMYAGIIDNKAYYCSKEKASTVGLYEKLKEVKRLDAFKSYEFDGDIESDATEVYFALRKKVAEDEASEKKRLLYVALTRAVRSVALYIHIGSKCEGPKSYENCGYVKDLYETLTWSTDGIRSKQNLNYGGGQLGCLVLEKLPFSSEAEKTDEVEQTFDRLIVDKKDCNTSFTVYPAYEPSSSTYYELADDVDDMHSYTSLSKFSPLEAKKITKKNPGYDTDLYSPIDGADGRDALDIGTEFHILAQCDLLKIKRSSDIYKPSDRVISAFEAWKMCEEHSKLVKSKRVFSEHEFCVDIEVDGRREYIIGALDALYYDDRISAYVVDYKTGIMAHDHRFQAIVYAYVLLKYGFESVELDFVHVEILSNETHMPYIVNFKYEQKDLPNLESVIADAFRNLHE